MTIQLPEHLQRYVREQVVAGRFAARRQPPNHTVSVQSARVGSGKDSTQSDREAIPKVLGYSGLG